MSDINTPTPEPINPDHIIVDKLMFGTAMAHRTERT